MTNEDYSSRIFHNPADFDEICGGVHKANRRISANLKIKRDTLQIYDGRLRAIGIAGVIQLTRNVELEIIPKFLGNNVGKPRYICCQHCRNTVAF